MRHVRCLAVNGQPISSDSGVSGAPIQMHEELWNATDDISTVLVWAILVGLWVITLAALAIASLIWPIYHGYGLLVLYLGGVLIVGSSAYIVYLALRSRALLRNWDEAFMPFLYSVKFEMLPVEGQDRSRDIWRRYKSLWRGLKHADPTTKFEKFWYGSELKFDASAQGKRSGHPLAIYARVENNISLIIRRYDVSSGVSRADLESLKSDSEDILKKRHTESFVVGAFSRTGFTPEAIAYAKSQESLVRDEIPLDLLEETATGYRVISVEIDQDSDD